MFGNWHKVQFDILEWNSEKRELSIRNAHDPNSDEYHERYGVIQFVEGFTSYTWKGENKYGDPDSPSIWKYTEIGKAKLQGEVDILFLANACLQGKNSLVFGIKVRKNYFLKSVYS